MAEFESGNGAASNTAWEEHMFIYKFLFSGTFWKIQMTAFIFAGTWPLFAYVVLGLDMNWVSETQKMVGSFVAAWFFFLIFLVMLHALIFPKGTH